MTGDQNDMLGRLQAVLPSRWFPDAAPVLAGLLSGLAQSASWLYGLIGYARAQTRIATAAGDWLDLVAQDFFGARLVRGLGEADAALRTRIDAEMFRPRATRAALLQQIQQVTGSPGWVFEPRRPADTGSWGTALAYGGVAGGGAGGWGNLGLPFQCFVVAHRPHQGGVPSVAAYGGGPGGYGLGALMYAPAAVTGTQADLAIMAAIADVMPTCGVAWSQISP